MHRQRWKVAVLDDDPRSQREFTEAIERAGGTVAAMSDRMEDAVPVVAGATPDVTVLAVSGRAAAVELAEVLLTAVPCPLVLFTSELDDEVIRRAAAAGAMAFLMKPLRAAELSPTLDLAIARFKDIRHLRQQLADRKVIERAKGLLMARVGLSENQAFQLLRRTAMNRRLRMVQVARSVMLAESSWDAPLAVLEGPAARATATSAGTRRAADG